ncbi:MAG: 4-hydroxy-3-methylbut-2-enyl diphosphate reductase [Alphaproteobacteria bacterium]|nr:4-hydroxy-3-methylbut-2-enyl diphosphate reductase [Alphaproteobacteria bacterium]
MTQRSLTILLAAPRGFCAGVERAIQAVEHALETYGRPVYVRHEIVHNRFVVETLEEKGAIFVEDLDEVPDDRPVVFSAHGVPKVVPAEATRRKMVYLDATCPLVSKVHREAERHYNAGRHMLLIGHESHPEVIGTMGQLPPGSITLIENPTIAETIEVPDKELAYITQTTLSVDEAAETITILKRRFPKIFGPKKEDICYATTNRQLAVKAIAPRCDAFMVIGATNSSNSMRLVEVALSSQCPKAVLVQRASEIDWDWLANVNKLGISAGASAPEVLVEEVIQACRGYFNVNIEEVTVTQEHVHFKLPRAVNS